jgi:hypothetical protein
MPEGGLVESSIKINVQEALLGELFCLSQNTGFIPLLEPGELLFRRHIGVS